MTNTYILPRGRTPEMVLEEAERTYPRGGEKPSTLAKCYLWVKEEGKYLMAALAFEMARRKQYQELCIAARNALFGCITADGRILDWGPTADAAKEASATLDSLLSVFPYPKEEEAR